MADEAESPSTLHSLHQDARAIFSHALDACRLERVFQERVRFDGTTLINEHSPDLQPTIPASRIDLSSYRKTLVIALGKAALSMTQSLLDILPRNLHIRGVCSAPAKPARRDWRIRYYAGGHPLPNRDSFRAAQHSLRLLRRASEKTCVIYLLSGGGSTLFDLPLDPEISLSDTITFHEALIASGATIAEINTLRKHFSAVKGGRLATASPRARKLTLQVVDVPWHQADAVASGPTLADTTTVDECRELLDRYRLLEKFPTSVRRFFNRHDLPETPGDKTAVTRDDAGLEQVSFASSGNEPAGLSGTLVTLLSNRDLVLAASEKAAILGYEVIVDNGCDDWPYDKAAVYLVDRLIALRRQHPGRKLCLLSGGEVTVRIDREPGSGGRNQQFALACGLLLRQELPNEPVVCLSGGSDGVDGNSPAAGAIADATTVRRSQSLGLDPQAALARFDAGPLFTALGDSIVTGPTGNNLRDLRILLSV
jgi:hydroxypyruvate reductase